MITIGRSPYRISLLGGGSDLDWFVEKENYGLSLGFAMQEYAYSVIQLKKDSDCGILNYSTREIYQNIEDIVNPLLRESLRLFEEEDLFFEIASYGFASGGSGLGGSSAFLISLLAALFKSIDKEKSKLQLAEIASNLEIDVLKKPIGRQDHYISANGSISAWEYNKSKIVKPVKLSKIKEDVVKEVINGLYLIPSKMNRSADKVLQGFIDNQVAIDSFKEIRSITNEFLKFSSSNKNDTFEFFNECMRKSWDIKRNMTNIMDSKLNNIYDRINEIPNNWIRIIGAGGGGYFLLSSKLNELDTFSFLNSLKINDAIKVKLNLNGCSCISF